MDTPKTTEEQLEAFRRDLLCDALGLTKPMSFSRIVFEINALRRQNAELVKECEELRTSLAFARISRSELEVKS